MAIIKVGDHYADSDFSLLTRHLNLLDIEVTRINSAIKASVDPESDGLFDTGEYFIGSGFVAIQRYLTSTYSGVGIAQSMALDVPPIVNNNLKFAETINAGANYWKHVEEWFGFVTKVENVPLKRNALKTLEKLEMATPWKDYTCANLLAVLGTGKELELSALLPRIVEWRDNLMSIVKRF